MSEDAVETKNLGGTRSQARRNKKVLMVKSAVYAAIGFTAISSIALAEDLSSATAPLPPGTFTTSAHSDEWKIANALSAGPASITEDAAVIDWPANPRDGMSPGRARRHLSNNEPYLSRLSSTDVATPIWVVPVAKGGDRIKEEPAK